MPTTFECACSHQQYSKASHCIRVAAIWVDGQRFAIDDIPNELRRLRHIENAAHALKESVSRYKLSPTHWPTDCG